MHFTETRDMVVLFTYDCFAICDTDINVCVKSVGIFTFYYFNLPRGIRGP